MLLPVTRNVVSHAFIETTPLTAAMAYLAVLAAVIAALFTATLFAVVVFSVYLVIVHRRYAHIPKPKGAS